MFFAFGNRQTIEMRTYPTGENGVAVNYEMMGGDRRRQVRAARGDIVDRLFGGGVLEHDAQVG